MLWIVVVFIIILFGENKKNIYIIGLRVLGKIIFLGVLLLIIDYSKYKSYGEKVIVDVKGLSS